MANMTYCGRIYLDPRNKRDIYINIGWIVKDKQVYPPYEQWLAPYVTQDKYHEWIEELQKVFAESPFGSEYVGMCAMMLCALTSGVCFCPCVYLKIKSDSFKKEVQDAFAKFSDGQARLEHTENGGPQNGMWTDSKGQTLMLGGGKYGPRPGGPPLGFNIIINLPTPIQWPPTVQMAPQPMGYAPPPVGYVPPPAGYGPPSAGYGQPSAGYGHPSAGYGPPSAGYGQPSVSYAPPPEVEQNAEPVNKYDNKIA